MRDEGELGLVLLPRGLRDRRQWLEWHGHLLKRQKREKMVREKKMPEQFRWDPSRELTDRGAARRTDPRMRERFRVRVVFNALPSHFLSLRLASR